MANPRRVRTDAVQVVAPNGVTWTRTPDGRSSPEDLLWVLTEMMKDHVEREWDWWQEGCREQERDRKWAILHEWDNGVVDPDGNADPEATAKAFLDDLDRRGEAERDRRARLAAEQYDKERESLRSSLLRTEADAAFFAHVVAAPAGPAQQDAAERRLAERQEEAKQLRSKLGDPDQVIDANGHYPAERREMNL